MASRVTFINPPGTPPAGMYSHAAVCTPGRLAFIAGQTAVDLSGAPVCEHDFTGQVPAVFDNLERVLQGLGACFSDVVQFTTYLVGTDKREAWQQARKYVFARIYPDGRYPPNTLLIVDALARPEYLLEIAAIARLPD